MSSVAPLQAKRDALQYSRKQNSLGQVLVSPNITGPLCRKKKKGESILRVKTLEESLNPDSVPKSSSATSTTSCLTATTISESSTRRSSLDSNTSVAVSTCSGFTITPQQKRKNVSFSSIAFRQYNMTIGDNPSCSSGAPVSLHWSYDPEAIVCSIDDYEKSKEEMPPRSRAQMLIPMHIRHSKLKEEWCVSTSEILRAIKENKFIQEQRYKSSMQKDASVRAEAMFQNVKCSVRRLIAKD